MVAPRALDSAAGQKDHRLWGRECSKSGKHHQRQNSSKSAIYAYQVRLSIYCSFLYKMLSTSLQHKPCIRLARGKFELTNQDSAGGKKFSVLASMWVDRKGIEIRQLFSLEMAWNIHERGFPIPKTILHCKKWKIWNIWCLQASNLAPNSSSSSVAM